jgi:uncharacterized membrane protein YccC
MRPTREVQHFIYGQHFSNGLRITFGTLLPALLGFYLGNLSIGIIVSLGALYTSFADSAGPVSHRRNAMIATIALIFFTALITKILNPYPYLLSIELFVLCFLYAMLAVYGPRAAAVGTAGMLMIVVNMQDLRQAGNILEHAGFIALGGIWYAVLSLALTQFRPYRQAQQELSENLHEIATFLRIKASFYELNTNTEEGIKKLIEQQVTINERQHNLREILFKSKIIVKESTNIGRILLVVFRDLVDFFEESMATQYDYEDIRNKFGHLPVYNEFKIIIIRLANELDNLSYFFATNKRPKPLHDLQADFNHLKNVLDESEGISEENIFVLKKILINVRNLINRIDQIYGYFGNRNVKSQITDLSKFVDHYEFDWSQFRNNLSLRSDYFRHAVRFAIVMIIGFLIANSFEFGNHSYWILLTIGVILKPGFSLSKKRVFQRLTGTFIGGIGGVIIIILIQDPTARFFILLLFMVMSFSLIQKNYILSVIFMTPYLLILFTFLGIDTMEVAQERVIDTLIGGFLAFTSSYIIFPTWEGSQVKSYMRNLLIANYNYLVELLDTALGKEQNITEYKLIRKEVYVNTANLASAFQRMITEPKSTQKNSKEVHSFIVFNHLLSSYTANLFITVEKTNKDLNGEPIKILRQLLNHLSQIIQQLDDETSKNIFEERSFEIPESALEDKVDSQEKKLIIEQLLYLKKILKDIDRILHQLWK